MATTSDPTSRKPLRLWPGVTAAVLLVLIKWVVPVVAPKAEFLGLGAQSLAILGGLLFGVLILLWWLFFSRARWSERLLALAVMILAVIAIRPLTHISIQNGMMGLMFYVYAVPPTLSFALVVWASASRRLTGGPRRLAMIAAMVLGCAVWMVVRTNGILGGIPDLQWRWTPTAEERLLAELKDEPLPLDSARGGPASLSAPTASASTPMPDATGQTAGNEPPASPTVAAPTGLAMSERGSGRAGLAMSEPGIARVEWPGFRGADRADVVRGGVRINTDWAASPPIQIWRRPIGPGWSSFAVSGDLLYTQEQRGEDEIVAAYRVSTGEPVWRHRDRARFWESNGGAGPRATPSLSHGRVYSLGATGILNALDARTGAVVWSRNAQADTDAKLPGWGFTGSPLVVGDLVIVAVSGTLAGYDAATGKVRWTGTTYGGSYSSPHMVTIGGVPQIVLLAGRGAIGVAPADGKRLWEHAWEGGAIIQPAMTAEGDILIHSMTATGGQGVRRLALKQESGAWKVEERWTSIGLKPYFSDFVIHDGHAYGFDGAILACIDLADGKRKWKGGRYGEGQLVLLADQNLLLVQAEEGEIVLVSATTDKFTEIARFPALDGKTWNHPVLIGDLLLLRNSEEMAAFRLSAAPASR